MSPELLALLIKSYSNLLLDPTPKIKMHNKEIRACKCGEKFETNYDAIIRNPDDTIFWEGKIDNIRCDKCLNQLPITEAGAK